MIGSRQRRADKTVLDLNDEDAMDATKEALLKSLGDQRAHVLGALEGLDAAALRRPVLPTNWNCVGMVHHLALDVDRLWFRHVVAGEHLDGGEDATSAWKVGAETSPEDVLALYRDEIERANVIIEATPLDAAPKHWPAHFGS